MIKNGLRYLEDAVTLEYNEEKCNGCRMCTFVCPHGVFGMNGKKAVLLDRGACMECGACALNCKRSAITVNAGVGCAAAVIKGFFKGTEPVCDCSSGSDGCC